MPAPVRRLPVWIVFCVVALIAATSVSTVIAVVPPLTAVARSAAPAMEARRQARHADPPSVWFTYNLPSPMTSDTGTIVINWCDDIMLVPTSRYFTVRGLVVTTSYTPGTLDGCGDYATSSALVNFDTGSNALVARIRGDNFEWGEADDAITRVLPPPVILGVNLTPDGSVVSKTASVPDTQYFTIKNTGNKTTKFNLSVTCAGTGIASGCNLNTASKQLAAGVTDSVYVAFTAGTAGTAGRIDVTADSGYVRDDAYVTINVPAATPPANYPVVDLSTSHPGTTVERGACLTIRVGASAAYECGDLRLVHALPTVSTLTKARTPTLLYVSAHNTPYPVVAADVSVPTGSNAAPDSVTAALSIGGTQMATGKWTGSAWSVGGAARRIGLGYDASLTGTGVKSYSLEVDFFIGGTRYATTKTGELVVVDRRASEFGAGWWLAGLEQLFFVTGGRILWVGGDGSSRVYTDAGLVPSMGTRRWVAPNVDRPDSMFHDTTSGQYTRVYKHGVRVVFNSAGQHISTVNRLGQTTTFARTGVRLDSIIVPPAAAHVVYRFSYTASARLDSVVVRGPTGGSTRTTIVTDSAGVLKTIRDPGDTVSMTFNYVSATNANVRGLKDRSGHWNIYAYDAWNRLNIAQDTVGAQVLTDTLVAAESRAQPGQPSVRTDSVFTRYNGPRDDVHDAADITNFTIDRFGAPATITNALGFVTRIDRADIRWPGLSTRVVQPNGRSVVALYETRGNLRSTTDSSTVQNGFYAVSRFEWDTTWDFVTRTTTPMGVVMSAAYDASTGNRLSQQDGRGSPSQATFSYWSTGIASGLLRSTDLPGGIMDSVTYDTVLGNVAVTRTPKGYQSKVTRDSIGRVLTSRSQIDTATSVDALAEEQRFTYDLRDLVTNAVSYGPIHEGVDSQKVVVQNFYDDERRPTQILRQSAPDPSSVGWVKTAWKLDAIGRRIAEVAGDGQVDSTFYNADGSPDSVRTRRGLKIRFHYDALGRLLERRKDTVTYAADTGGIPTYVFANQYNTPYPRFLKNGSGGMTIPGEDATFTYDSVGNLLTADNADAKVRRTWWTNGLLKTETQKIQTYARDDTTKHVYTMTYAYDLDGRRVQLTHPPQLAPHIGSGQADSVLYGYDAQTGALTSVTDLLGNLFTFTYDLRNELTLEAAPGSWLSNVFAYDNDGQLVQHATYDSTHSTTDTFPSKQLRNTSLRHDARGKVLWSANTQGLKDTLRAHYSGLGHLRADSASNRGINYQGSGIIGVTTEVFIDDALGNIDTTRTTWSGVTVGASESEASAQWNTYRTDSTGRLSQEAIPANLTSQFFFDAAGNLARTKTAGGSQGAFADERVSYYDAGGALVAADRRIAAMGGYQCCTRPFDYTFEEFRYDALGRRVLVRSRRQCQQMFTTVECPISTIRRTVWDGASELWEIQMPGFDNASVATLETDTTTLADQQGSGDYSGWDLNPYYGRVGYAYGLVLDEPLSLTRVQYADHPPSFPLKYWTPFTIIPHWDDRGSADNGSFADGTGSFVDGTEWKCDYSTGTRRCVNIAWPNGMFSYNRKSYQPPSWHGTLLDQKRDESGTLYRRNRYVDPMTGRFTQEDPAGVGAGMNLYGFASGDPVNYSDPFGLKVCFVGSGAESLANAARRGTQTRFTLDSQGCAVGVSPTSKNGWDEVSQGFADLANEPNFRVNVQYGESETGGSGTDPKGIHIDKQQIGVHYGTAFVSPGVCSSSPGATYSEQSMVTHELGHAFGTFQGQSEQDNSNTAVRWENTVHAREGRPLRSQQCHVK